MLRHINPYHATIRFLIISHFLPRDGGCATIAAAAVAATSQLKIYVSENSAVQVARYPLSLSLRRESFRNHFLHSTTKNRC